MPRKNLGLPLVAAARTAIPVTTILDLNRSIDDYTMFFSFQDWQTIMMWPYPSLEEQILA